MLITLGLGSALGYYTVIVEVACSGEQTPKKTLITAIILFIGFLVSTVYVTPGGQQILQLVDFFTSSFVIIILALLESLASKF